MAVLLGNIDVLIVKSITSAELTGYYGALKILGTTLLTINMAIIAVILPKACATGHKGEAINVQLLLGAYGLIALISGIATILYYLLPQVLISILFGSRYLFLAPDLWLFGVMTFALSVLLLEGHIAFAKHDYYISYVLAGIVVCIGLAVFLYHQSIREIALAITGVFVLGYGVTLALNLAHREKKVDRELLKI